MDCDPANRISIVVGTPFGFEHIITYKNESSLVPLLQQQQVNRG